MIIGGLRSAESTTYFGVPSPVSLCLLGVLAHAVVLRCGKPRRVRKGNESPLAVFLRLFTLSSFHCITYLNQMIDLSPAQHDTLGSTMTHTYLDSYPPNSIIQHRLISRRHSFTASRFNDMTRKSPSNTTAMNAGTPFNVFPFSKAALHSFLRSLFHSSPPAIQEWEEFLHH